MRPELIAYKLGLPSGLDIDTVAGWLDTIAAGTHPPRFALVKPPPTTLEVVATKQGISYYLVVHSHRKRLTSAGLRAAMPVRLDEAPAHISERSAYSLAAELAVAGSGALADHRAQAANAATLAAMQPLHADERVVVQVVMRSATAPADGSREQHRRLHLSLAVRVGVHAATRKRAGGLLHGVIGAYRLLNSPAAQIVRRRLPHTVVVGRLRRRSAALWRPVFASTTEAAGFCCFAPGVALPGVPAGSARQLPPATGMARSGCIVAQANYPGANRTLALRTADRLMHTYVPGPTGVGKSTLLVNMALQDIAAGYGVVFIDPKGDAIPDLLARTTPERQPDVMVINPAAISGHIVGWNALRMGGGELARELAVDHMVHILHELWRGSWGPRTADVLRASLLTLTHTKAADGSAFAITDVPELLTNDRFRRFVLAQPGIPQSVRGFWDEYSQRSDKDRAAVIAPAMNKLRSFTTRTPLRLLLGQSDGIRLSDVFTKRRILLVSLAKGEVGTDTAQLLGSLLVAGIWQACLGRVAVLPQQRRPVMCYVDETQDVMRLPITLEDMAAQARGLGMGLILANQSLAQLPASMQSAMLGVVRSQIAFQLGREDATTLAPSFAPLTADDLQTLAAHEVAIRACVNGRTLRPVTGTTLPLPVPTQDATALAASSRKRFGTARTDVEAALARRLDVADTFGAIGRQRRGVAP